MLKMGEAEHDIMRQTAGAGMKFFARNFQFTCGTAEGVKPRKAEKTSGKRHNERGKNLIRWIKLYQSMNFREREEKETRGGKRKKYQRQKRRETKLRGLTYQAVEKRRKKKNQINC